MPDEDRHSRALDAELISDPLQKAEREALNGLRQMARVVEMVEYYLHPERPFRLRPSHFLTLQREATIGLTGYAGSWRPSGVEIQGSRHNPPDAHQVPELIEDLCEYVNTKWQQKSALHLAAYVMWKLNWIHPFTDGNGRTSRAASHLVLCLKLGYVLPGKPTIPDQIAANKKPYYAALEAADANWVEGTVNLSVMKAMLDGMLAAQLLAIHKDSRSGDD